MDLTNDELEDCVEKFRNVFLKNEINRRNENDLLLLLENLSEELNICRENENKLRNKIKCLLESKSSELTKKYVLLEEKCRKLELENKELKTQYEDLDIQMKNKLELQKNEFLGKLKENLERSKSETTNLKNQIESDKICYESKEKELNNELQAVQAANAIQLDELESNLKRQIVDANSKLRQAQNTIRALQLELNNLRNQQQRYTGQKNNVLHFESTPIQVLKNTSGRQSNNHECLEDENEENDSDKYLKGRHSVRVWPQGPVSKNQLVVNSPQSTMTGDSSGTKTVQEWNQHDRNDSNDISKLPLHSSVTPKLWQNDITQNSNCSESFSHIQPTQFCNKTVQVMKPKNQFRKQLETIEKYSPLPLYVASSYEEFEPCDVNPRNKSSYAPALHKTTSSATRTKNLPPLMLCSDANKGKRKPLRKRKLYNPDDYSCPEEGDLSNEMGN
ncbi:uncharacterized protein [Leptinotarsa decemlineata]|uniref:uncharacterized protein n=1 Tax=Leptinotarsa decemlineata TaxID=7539 RepID=UPI003D30C3EA